jgi:EAL domain-containing protein (putative c-di-GMP-specific phosphodiesterase class I)
MGLHAHAVYLEITETAAFDHYDLCMDVLGEVSSRIGVHLVVDDFGAGHSTMDRVLALRPAVVKLDGHLVRGVHADVRRREVMTRVIRECRALGARVVAECVETEDELSAVRDAGADYVQGCLLARPSFPVPSVVWPERVALASRPHRAPVGRAS